MLRLPPGVALLLPLLGVVLVPTGAGVAFAAVEAFAADSAAGAPDSVLPLPGAIFSSSSVGD